MAKKATEPIRVKVRAIKDGYYEHAYRRAGSVFILEGLPPDPSDPKQAKRDPKLPAIFSPIWMQVVDEDTPERNIGSAESLRQQHDDVNIDRFNLARPATGDRDVLNG